MQETDMTRQRHRSTGRKDFPSSLQGGEARDAPEHRIGETERQSPQIDKPDPGSAQPEPERSDTPRRPADTDDKS
jgi:hypothetical protein